MNLLDVNILIALADQDHLHHEVAEKFLRENQRKGWVTCPLTENAFVRILGNPNYPGGPGNANESRKMLSHFVLVPGHQFWPDDLSITETKAIASLPGSKAITDLYLLALAVKHGGRFVSLDRRLDASQVTGGKSAYLVL